MASISKIKIPNGTTYDINAVTVNDHTVNSDVPKDAKFTDTTYNAATTSVAGLMSADDKKSLDILKTPYATCATARATAAKVATLANFSLTVGVTIAVKFTATDTTNPTSGILTLNVNNTGAKNIGYFRNGSKAAFNYNSSIYFYNNVTHIFTYDGTYWLCMDWNADNNTTYTNESLGQGYGTCATAEATAAKVVSLSNYALTVGGVIAVKFTYAVPASATLNINSKGAKPIYYRGAAITAGIIKAGDTATFVYNGSQYHLLTIDIADAATKLTTSAGSANQPVYFSNGKPVACDSSLNSGSVHGVKTKVMPSSYGDLFKMV